MAVNFEQEFPEAAEEHLAALSSSEKLCLAFAVTCTQLKRFEEYGSPTLVCLGTGSGGSRQPAPSVVSAELSSRA